MAFCDQCGERLNEKARFCPSCGTPAPEPPRPAEPTPPEPKPTAPEPDPPPPEPAREPEPARPPRDPTEPTRTPPSQTELVDQLGRLGRTPAVVAAGVIGIGTLAAVFVAGVVLAASPTAR